MNEKVAKLKPPFEIYLNDIEIADADGHLCTAESPEHALAIVAALNAAGQEWRGPEGWKLAPIDPTPEMVAVCQIASRTLGPREMWRRMMSALPAPPVAEPLLAEKQTGE